MNTGRERNAPTSNRPATEMCISHFAAATKSFGRRAGNPRLTDREHLTEPCLLQGNHANAKIDPTSTWTGVKLHGYLKEQLGLELGYSTTARYLHELGYNLRVPGPWPERQNVEHAMLS